MTISTLPMGFVSAQKVSLIFDGPLKNVEALTKQLKLILLYRILRLENDISLRYFGKEFRFKVEQLIPVAKIRLGLEDEMSQLSLTEGETDEYMKVTPETEITINQEIHQSDLPKEPLPIIGGVTEQLEKIFELIRLATKSLHNRKPIEKPSRGIILFGPSGCGKTLLCNYLSRCDDLKDYKFIRINASGIFSKFLGESEGALRSKFNQAFKNHPSPTIIVLEDIHILSKKNDNSDFNRRMTSGLLNCMDELSSNEQGNRTLVIATTTQIEDLDGTLLRSGRFDSFVELPIPSPDDRFDILSRGLSVIPNKLTVGDVRDIANVTHGFVGADLISLLTKATVGCSTDSGMVTANDINKALTLVKPSAMLEILIEVPTVHWEDIGGQHELKLKLKQSVDWPLKNPEVFKRFGIKPPKGILMYGPPGCSKTMIGKALATESRLNFLSIKGPELFSMWVGESERAVRELFRKARTVSPAIIFFDEIDAIGGERQGGQGSSVNERVLAQLLTEMDGVTTLDNVTIVAATNRPDMIDKALLRPGRIDRVIYVGLPDATTRREIFRIKWKQMKVDIDVDMDKLVELTEGYSGAEIQAICQEAALKTLEESLSAESVSWRHFLSALSVVKPRTNKELLDLYERYEKQFKEKR